MKNKIILSFTLLCFFSFLNAKEILPSEVYKLALENSNKLKAKKLEIDVKKENFNELKSQYLPQADFMIDWNKSYFERNELITTSDRHFDETSLDYTLMLNQKVFDMETNTKLNIEKKRLALYDLELQREIQNLSQEVFQAYLLALGSKNRMEFLNSLVDYNAQKYESIEKKFKLKLANRINLLESKVDLEKSKIELNREEKVFELYLSKLKRYTLVENIDIPVLNVDEFNLNDIFDKEEFLKLDNIENNLEMQQYTKMIEISSLEIENAKSSYYPKVDLSARYVKYVSDDRTTDYENMGRVSLKLTMPLYKGGARSSRIASLRINKRAKMEEFENVKQELKLMNDELKATVLTTADSVQLFREALHSSRTYLELVTLGYENGLSSIVDLYEAKNKLFEIKNTYINTIQEFIDAYVRFLIINNKVENVNNLDKIL